MASNQQKWWSKTISSCSPSNKNSRSASSRSAIGERAEGLACDYLRLLGYTVWQRNYRPRHPGKEIDIVAFDPSTGSVVFVEVKSSRTALPPIINMTPHKLRVLSTAIAHYLRHSNWSQHYRLEYIGLHLAQPRSYQLEHLVLDMI